MTGARPAPAPPLVDISAETVLPAVEGNMIELWRACCAHLSGAEFHENADAVWFTTGNASAPWLNQVLLARFANERLDGRIGEALAHFRQRRLPMLWSIAASTRPPDLGDHLGRHGLAPAGTMPAMAIDLDAMSEAPAPPEFRIERVGSVEALHAWAGAYIDSFQMEEASGRVLLGAYEAIGFGEDAPARHYVGLLNGNPVASATLFMGAGVAGIWHVGTLPEARRQGIGAAMTLAPLGDARALGYRVGTLHASVMGAGVYRRLGFKEYGRMEQYQWSP